MKAFFDPAAPMVLLRWRDVRPVTGAESARLRERGALWLPLAGDPFDKTAAGSKIVEVRNDKPQWRRFQPGKLVVLSRAYREPHLVACIDERIEAPDFASIPADLVALANLGGGSE